MIGQVEDLQQTALYRELKRRSKAEPLAREYCALIEGSFGQLHKYLDEIRRFFCHFTDHCITHSLRIVYHISSFLSPSHFHKLTRSEIYLIICSSLIHDIGMVLSESEAGEIWASEKFQRDYGPLIRENFLADPERMTVEWATAGIGRFLLADYVRREHGNRAVLTVNSRCLPITLLTGGSVERGEYMGLISKAHTLEFEFLANERNLPTDRLLDERRVNLRFVAICLRLGDLLDISSNRICPVIRQLSEPLPYLSRGHWDQYKGVRLHEPRYGSNITVSGRCPTQESHRLLKDWLHWLSTEVASSVTLLNTSAIRDQQYHLRIGRVIDDVKPETGRNGLPKYEFLEYRFNLDEERVFERLFGERLYGRTDLAIRELLQNAVDATRYRVAHELHKKFGKDKIRNKPIKLYEEIYRNKEKLAIRVALSKRPSDEPVGAPEHFYLSVEDRGIGMSRQTIADYLLKVGRSRWKEDPLVKDFTVGEIGEFGVGFLSTFMIADRIVIETRSALPDESPVRATIQSWKSYITTEPILREAIGTRVELKLKPGAVAELGTRLEALE